MYTQPVELRQWTGSQPGQAWYNKAELDRNGDGITDLTDDACGDLTIHQDEERFSKCIAVVRWNIQCAIT